MPSAIYIKIPFPPSVNTYWRNIVIQGKPRTIMSKRGREYREQILTQIQFDGMTRPALSGRLSVEVELCPPDKKKRDIDNFMKGILDGMTHAGVWNDDEQVDELIIKRLPPERGGWARLRIIERQ